MTMTPMARMQAQEGPGHTKHSQSAQLHATAVPWAQDGRYAVLLSWAESARQDSLSGDPVSVSTQ